MSARPRISNEKRRPDPEDVRRLHAAGESRNAVARALGVSTRQVDNVAAEIGVSWSAAATRDAVEVQRNTAETDRLELAKMWRDLARDSLARALVEGDTQDRRRLAGTAEAATRSDLAIWSRKIEGNHVEGGAGAEFEELVAQIRGMPVPVVGDDGKTVVAVYRTMDDVMGAPSSSPGDLSVLDGLSAYGDQDADED